MVWIFTSSVFMTVGPVRRHGDVRIGEPHGGPWYVTLEDIGRSSLAEIYTSIVLAIEAGEGLNTQDNALRVMSVSDRLFEDWMATYHPPRFPGHSFSPVKHASIASTFEACECPNTPVSSRRLASTTRT